MRHETEALLGDELAGQAADTVRLVLDAGEGPLEVLDELVLALGELAGFFLGELVRAVVLDGLEGGRGILNVVAAIVHHDLAEVVVLAPGLFEHTEDDGLELLEFGVTVTGFLFFHSSITGFCLHRS